MRIRLTLRGLETLTIEGEPRDVLKRADEILVKWKVIWNGEAKGKGR